MLDKHLRIALVSSASALLLSACSGGGGSTPNVGGSSFAQSFQSHQSSITRGFPGSFASRMGLVPGSREPMVGGRNSSPGFMTVEGATSGSKLYVSDLGLNAVEIYNGAKPGSPVGMITTGISSPLGNCTDAASNLYVTNIGNNTVTVYAKGKTSPSKTLSSGLSGPIGCAVGKDGTLYVSEYSADTVVEYDKGKTSPSRTITVAGGAEGVALDSKNNLYVSYNSNSTGTGQVEKFAPKKTTGTVLGLSVQFAGDLKFNKANVMLLEDQIAQAVEFFKPPYKTSSGSISVSGFDTYKLALNATESDAFLAVVAAEVPYYQAKPSGALVGTVTSGLSESSGVSLTPAPPN